MLHKKIDIFVTNWARSILKTAFRGVDYDEYNAKHHASILSKSSENSGK
jgi:hypothetical protein